MADSAERQDELGRGLHGLRKRLDVLDEDGGGTLTLTRADIEALRDCIELALAVRLITVDCR